MEEEDSWRKSDKFQQNGGEDMEIDLSSALMGSSSESEEDIFSTCKKLGSKASKFTTEEEEEEKLCLSEEFLNKICKQVSISFFEKFGLINHQLNSYNEFIEHGIHRLFDSIPEMIVDPGFDPSKNNKKGEREWKCASVSFGKVTLERPMFWNGDNKPSLPDDIDDDKKKKKKKEYLTMLPRHARIQNMTYAARMKVEVIVKIYMQKHMEGDTFEYGKEQFVQKEVLREEKKEIVIGRIPVMVKSNLCWMHDLDKSDCDFDHGGYFLIKGSEKIFVAQEQTCMKRLWVTDNPNWMVSYRSESKRRRVFVKLVEAPIGEDQYIHGGKVLNAYFKSSTIPLWILFFALGMSSDKEIIDMLDVDLGNASYVEILFATIHNADKTHQAFRKEGEALKWIDELIKSSEFPPEESIKDIVDKELFPSLNSPKLKAVFLGYMVTCLFQSFTRRRKCDIKDDFRNKRLELAGELLERELRIHILHAERQMVKPMKKDLYSDRILQPIEQYLDASYVTNGLSRAFSTGNWSHAFKSKERTSGVVATLKRTNPLQMMAEMRKTRHQVGFVGKGEIRFPNPSHWGRLCFLSTPDGKNCGLVKNLAVTGLVSTNLIEPLMDKLLECEMKKLVTDASSASWKGKNKIFLNGEWVGVCEDSLSFVVDFKSKRRNKEIPPQVEIKRDHQQREVRIFSDAGRILRPLLIVENLNKLKMVKGGCGFQSLLDEGVLELIGVEEEEDLQIAWGIKYLFLGNKDQPPVKYTHCELDLSFLMGLSCGLIPFANHDNAKRALYQSEKHSQQAIGFSTTNPNIRVDTLSHQLYYPQRPLFRSMISDCLGGSAYPVGHNGIFPKPEYFNGQNAIVAVNVHQGYNQEDSLVMNRASLERGMFRTEHVRSYKAEVDNNDQSKKLKVKDKVDFGKIESKFGRVEKLDDDGFPFIGAHMQAGDIIIGRLAESGADHSIKLKHTEKGKVQKVVLTANDDGKNVVVVSLQQVRSPSVGDKFSSMHGQKGVIGHLESQENFPFTRDGVVPDIVINPHAFPTRQTPGQLLEAALGKGIACGGSIKYATPFTAPSVEVIADQLHRAGYSRWGSERVYNGQNGEMMKSLIFMAPTFYQRLIHMAEDKVKFRNTGPVNPHTRQPVVERKRFGGVKFGEMERDCLLAHGAAANLNERLFTLSDFSQMHVCHECKNIANVSLRPLPRGGKIRGPYCRFCESSENIVKVDVPYAAKLLTQELFSMGIRIKFETEQC